MNVLKNKSIKSWSFILIGLGGLGAIFFFPVDINSRYTCLYHRIFCDDAHIHKIVEKDAQKESEIIQGEFEQSDGQKDSTNISSIINSNSNNANSSMHFGSELLDNYIRQFALFWWSSLLLLVVGFYFLRYTRNSNKYSMKIN